LIQVARTMAPRKTGNQSVKKKSCRGKENHLWMRD